MKNIVQTVCKKQLTTNPIHAIIQHISDFFMEIYMRPLSFQIALPRQRRRAVELYSRDTPFRHRAEQSRVQYRRRAKHVKKGSDE
jgi:hypothetical protein